jgi:hypothetical protein
MDFVPIYSIIKYCILYTSMEIRILEDNQIFFKNR